MTTLARAFVIALTLTGATSSIHTGNTFAGPVAHPRPSDLPVPMCPPSDPNGCGIANRN